MHLIQIGKNPGRDADGRSSQRGADENGCCNKVGGAFTGRVRNVGPVEKTQQERQRHTHRGHRERRRPNPEHLTQIGFQPDLEQQEHHTELGENMNHLAGGSLGRDDAEHAASQQHPGDQLAEYRRLADSFGQLAQQLGRNEYDCEGDEQPGDRELGHRLQSLLGPRMHHKGVLEER